MLKPLYHSLQSSIFIVNPLACFLVILALDKMFSDKIRVATYLLSRYIFFMDKIFEHHLPFMVFLQDIANPVLDIIAQVITVFGESPIPLLSTIFIYWCFDKKKGFVIISSLMSAMMSMQVLKAIFRVPRPFMRYPELITAKRETTATGFSFPSGHSTTAAAFYGSLVYLYKFRWLRALCISLIVLVPISRLYLGAHWPLDITIGTLIGLIAALFLGKYFDSIYEKKRSFFLFCATFGSCSFALSILIAIIMDVLYSNYSSLDLFKQTDIYRALHNLMQNSAIASGLFIGMIADKKYLNFIPSKGPKERTLSYIIGLALLAVIAYLITMIPFCKFTFEFVLFCFTGLWVTFLFPLIAHKLGFMEKELQ